MLSFNCWVCLGGTQPGMWELLSSADFLFLPKFMCFLLFSAHIWYFYPNFTLSFCVCIFCVFVCLFVCFWCLWPLTSLHSASKVMQMWGFPCQKRGHWVRRPFLKRPISNSLGKLLSKNCRINIILTHFKHEIVLWEGPCLETPTGVKPPWRARGGCLRPSESTSRWTDME